MIRCASQAAPENVRQQSKPTKEEEERIQSIHSVILGRKIVISHLRNVSQARFDFVLLGLEDRGCSSRWHVDRLSIHDHDTTERQRHEICVPTTEDLFPACVVGHRQDRSPRRLGDCHNAWLDGVAWPTWSIRRKGCMIPTVDFPHDFPQTLSTSPATRTTCHVYAEALQHPADELTIFATTNQDCKPL